MKKIILLLLTGVFLLASCDSGLTSDAILSAVESYLSTHVTGFNDAWANTITFTDPNDATRSVTTTVSIAAPPDSLDQGVLYSETVTISSSITDSDPAIPESLDFTFSLQIEEISPEEYANASGNNLKITLTFEGASPDDGTAFSNSGVFLMNIVEEGLELLHPTNQNPTLYPLDDSFDAWNMLQAEYPNEFSESLALINLFRPSTNPVTILQTDDAQELKARLILQFTWQLMQYTINSLDVTSADAIIAESFSALIDAINGE